MEMGWYTLEEVEAEEDQDKLLAMGLMMWANCYIENPPKDFGMMMVKIGEKLGVIALPDNLYALCEQRFGTKGETE